MSVPEPPVSLDSSCSVIYDNTLYSFGQDGFLSLALEKGAKWQKLEPGVPVTGATCVGSNPTDASQAGFWVVGGIAQSADYTGLQTYTFSSSNWTTITPTSLVTKDRQWHGATYIQANDAIAVYAGNQNGVKAASSETFSIGASPPYTAQSIPDTSAPAAISPILLPWSDADAVMVGGDPTNEGVFLFNPIAYWRNFGTTLSEPLAKDTSVEQAILVQGDDGSKSLITFDMSVSPNAVTRFVLQDATGEPVQNSASLSKRRKRTASNGKRDLTLQNWPNYNGKLAPTTTRTNFAIAQGDNGMVVFTGGSSEDPISMFNVEKNSWVSPATFFSGTKESVDKSSSSSSRASHTSTRSHTSKTSSATHTLHTTTSAATSTTAAATTSVSADASGTPKYDSNEILGITLGSILGFLALLGLLLLLMRRSKRQRNHTETGHLRRASGVDNGEKETMGYATNTVPPASPGHFRGHHPQMSQESYSSMAILMGRMHQHKPTLSRPPSRDSSRSSVSSLHKHFKSTISRPIPQTRDHPALQGENGRSLTGAQGAPVPRPRNPNGPPEGQDGMRRSSGWNRYWSGGSALQILGFGASKRGTVVSEQSSHYSQSTGAGSGNPNPRVTQDSATVPPLNFDAARPELNRGRVNSGSPVVSQSSAGLALKEGMSGKIERPASNASSGYSSGIPESVNEVWDATGGSKPWGADRAPSSAYNSTYNYPAPQGAGKKSSSRPPHSGVSNQPQLAMAATSSDMSWLNLGDQSRL